MDVATGPDGNIYVTGRFTGSLQLGATCLSNAGLGECLYIAKCQPDGRVLRVTKLKGVTDVLPRSIAVDAAGNCYVTSRFLGTITYDSGRQTIALNTPLGGPTYEVVNALTVDQKSRKNFASGFLNLPFQGTNQSFLTRLSAMDRCSK